MNLILALLLATGGGVTIPLSPAPGAAPLVSLNFGPASVQLDARGRGEIPAATALSSPGLRFYRAVDINSGREEAYYYPSSYSLVRLSLMRVQPAGETPRVIIKESTQKSWKDGASYAVHLEANQDGQLLRFVLHSGKWDIALLVPDQAPEFVLGVATNSAELALKPLSLRRAAGVRAEVLDSRSGRPPNRWSAFVKKLTADPQTEEAHFFSDRPIAADQNRLEFRSLPVGGWELRVEALGIGRRRALVSALTPGKSVDLGRFFISSVGAVRATLRFPSEIPPGDFAIRLSKEPANPAEPTHDPAATKMVTPKPETVVTFSDLEPGVWKVEAENVSGQIRRKTQVAIEASQISEALLVFNPVLVVGTVKRGDELVEDATIRAAAGAEGLEKNPTVSSNDKGEYALKVWAPPGRIALMTFPPDEQVPFLEMLQAGAETQRIEHDILLPAGQVTGTVRDAETGQPLPRARVEYGSSITKLELAEDEFRFSLRKESDREGRFRLGNLTEQPIDVRVTYEGYAPAVHPAVKATPDGVDLDIRLTKGFTLTGVVVDQMGRPIQGATVGLDTDSMGILFDRTASTSASGEFKFRSLRPGAHLLFVWKCGSSMAVQPVSIDAERRGVERVLLPPDNNPLIARFVDDSGKPLPRATARWVVNGQTVPVEEWGRLVAGCGLSPFSDGEGNLTLHGFAPGTLAALSVREQRPLGSFLHDGTHPIWTIRVAQGTK